MKAYLSIFITAFYFYTFPAKANTTADCENLSHRFTIMGMSVDYQQIGCEKYKLFFRGPDDKPYSEGQTLFSRELDTILVDDAYETTSNQQRWMFSRDGKSIIHEAVIDSLNKLTNEKKFWSLIEIISRVKNGNIQRASTEITRTEDAEGVVRVATKNESAEYLPLSEVQHL